MQYSILYREFKNKKRGGQKKLDLPKQGFQPQPRTILCTYLTWSHHVEFKKNIISSFGIVDTTMRASEKE